MPSSSSSDGGNTDVVLSKAIEWKTKGNQAFAASETKRAIICYNLGIQVCDDGGSSSSNEEDLQRVKAALLANRAMCNLKLLNARETIDDCSAGLEITSAVLGDQLRGKLWYRRAKARFLLWDKSNKSDAVEQQGRRDSPDLQEAASDVTNALEVDPHNKEAQKLLKEIQAAAEQQEQDQKKQPAAANTTVGNNGSATTTRKWHCHHYECHDDDDDDELVFDNYDDFAAHMKVCNAHLARHEQESPPADARYARTIFDRNNNDHNDAEDGNDFSSDDDDEDFEVENCRKCNKTPGQAAGGMCVCAKCKSVSYCSRQCQRDDWRRHRKHCKFLANDRQLTMAVQNAQNNALNDPSTRPMIEAANLAGFLDLNYQNTELGAIDMQGTLNALQRVGQLKSLLERYKDIANDSKKLAKKLLKAIRDNPDRPALHLEIYSHMIDGTIGKGFAVCQTNQKKDPRLWNACLASTDMVERLMSTVRVSMESDIRQLNSLIPGMTDELLHTKPVARFAVQELLFTRQPELNRMLPNWDEAKQYYSTCWRQHLDLSLSTWKAIELGLGYPLDGQLITACQETFYFFLNSEVVDAVFAEARRRDGKPFHDPQSPSLLPLLDLLDIRGHNDFRRKFHHHIYGIAALLVRKARSCTDPDIVSGAALEAVFTKHLDRPPTQQRLKFFQDLSLKWGGKFRDFLEFDEFMANHPEIQALI